MLNKILEYLDKKENIIFIRNVLLNNELDYENIIFNFKCHFGSLYDTQIIGNDEVSKKNYENTYQNFSYRKKELIDNMNMINISNFYSSMLINNIIDKKVMFEDIHINYIIILMDEIRKSFYFSEKERFVSQKTIKYIMGNNNVFNEHRYKLTTPNKQTHFVYKIITDINTIIGDNLYLHDFDRFVFKDDLNNTILNNVKIYLNKIHILFQYESVKYLYYEYFNQFVIIKSNGDILAEKIDEKHDKWKHFTAIKRKVNIQNLLKLA